MVELIKGDRALVTPRPAMEAPPPVPLPAAPVLAPREATVGEAWGGGRERCPRCASRDTKFCYYNNYNTAQPRHFCRACRRYWTLGGSLRNVPVGGSVRKRPRHARPATRALVAALTTTTTASSFASPPPVPAQSGLFGSLPLLALGAAAPLLEGRLGLAQTGDGEAGPFGFGAAPLLWPSMFLEGDQEDTWKAAAGVSVSPSPAALWQAMELAAAAGCTTASRSVCDIGRPGT